ncbi:phage tail assembly chaperone G [Salinicoccus carnicancri]|uniref:phage tail assembly chaperone G n=1 Tax=Salinicoccus carnicancri TaxID=558170 RepID=UPI0002F6F603|nr:hypothetical protein [Salinicoccus carnicancri]
MIELVLKDKDGNEKHIKREKTNLIEMEKFLELRSEVNEDFKNENHDEIKNLKRQVEFIAYIFRDQKVTEEDLMTGMDSDEFDDYFEKLCRQISPSHFKRSDEIRERAKSAGNKGKSK